jgi:septal ring factor EnvC (AmiA/AmiB activator)
METNNVLGLVGLFGTGAGTVVWWMFRSLAARVDSTERELAAYKLHVAETYVTSNELGKAIDAFNRSIDAIFAKLERIENKLDTKQDK